MNREIVKREHTGKFVIKPNVPLQQAWLPAIQNLAKEGKSVKEIALLLGFRCEKTLQKILDKSPEMLEAFETGKNVAKAQLILSMFQKAMGYTYEEVVTEYKLIPQPNGTVERFPFREIVRPKHIPGDTKMQIFLAKNYMAEDFKDITESETRELKVQVLAELERDKVKEFAGNLTKFVQSQEIQNADSRKS